MAKILVADDEHGICAAFAEFLRREQHEPLLASTGPEALQMAIDETPAMIFLDIQMPGMTGLEVLSEMRERDLQIPSNLNLGVGTRTPADDIPNCGFSLSKEQKIRFALSGRPIGKVMSDFI